MNYYIEDSELAKKNKILVIGGGSSIAYNAVLDVLFEDEVESGDDPTEPVTLDEAKEWCRIDVSDDDDIITELITAARTICEQYSNISFIPRTVTARLKNELGGIYLPYGPVTGDDPVFTDDEGIEAAVDAYKVVGVLFKAVKTPFTEMTAVYTAGYTALPLNLKKALLNQIAWMYSNRGDDETASVSEQSKLILNQVRRVH